jgi:hypothetical protein
VPIPTIGPTGPQGVPGQKGDSYIGGVGFFGTWEPSPRSYRSGSIVSFGGFLYLSKALLNISDNTQAPAGNPFWQVLGPSTFSGRNSSLIVVIDGNGTTPGTGLKSYVSVPFNSTITGWVLLADTSGSAVLDVKWTPYAGFPSTTSIVGSSNPKLISQQKNENLDVSTVWSPMSFNEGDILEIDLVSVSTATLLNLQLNLTAN